MVSIDNQPALSPAGKNLLGYVEPSAAQLLFHVFSNFRLTAVGCKDSYLFYHVRIQLLDKSSRCSMNLSRINTVSNKQQIYGFGGALYPCIHGFRFYAAGLCNRLRHLLCIACFRMIDDSNVQYGTPIV